jgi:Zn-finger nucleic acid-binding protein
VQDSRQDSRHRLPGSALRCACGALLTGPDTPPPTPARGLRCPRCAIALTTLDLAVGALHRCKACGGVFADCPAEKALVLGGEDAIEDLPAGDPPRRAVGVAHYAGCPRCETVMNRVNFGRQSGVLVDFCRDHGTWFDAAELPRVAAFLSAQARELPPFDEQEAPPDPPPPTPEEVARRAQAREIAEQMRATVPTLAEREAARRDGEVRSLLGLLLSLLGRMRLR